MTEDKEIIQAIRKNPEKGFRLFMDKYKKPVYWHIRRLVVSHADAQDVAQETFIRIFRSFSQCRDDNSFKAWIYRIATREALRLMESRHNEGSFSLEQAEANVNRLPADEYIDYSDLESVKLQRAIRSLPTKQQLVFNLRYYDELRYEEIAEIAACTAQSAKANYHIAKEKIIHYMNSNE
ncbi:RNA polymerase subunit sigma [Parabacteroides sp. An277]|uniref:RNA polymerase sigma factor n=1 Tax=Parabacteroides sp. An277 TaxID=1965619 RepID=UPI000B3A6D68|nr:RNA polymerase sigma factor [Parabacteroides sp. An277]OUO54061.1 RNA polymerase subunit sigma [Parabacteroides sp. An277]